MEEEVAEPRDGAEPELMKRLSRTTLALCCALLASSSYAADAMQTLGDWKAASDTTRYAFAYSVAHSMGARAPSIYSDDVRRCLDDKAVAIGVKASACR